MNVKSVLVDYAIVFGVAFLSVADDAMADSKQLLPEVIEKESARKRIVLDPYKPNASAMGGHPEADTNSNHTSDQNTNIKQKEPGQLPLSHEVRGILEQISKEKDALPGIVGDGGTTSMPQPMFQPEFQ
jgi:hypothetical protein